MTTSTRRPLQWWEIRQLEHQGCRSRRWDNVTVSPDTDLSLIANVRFEGTVSIGALSADDARPQLIENAVIADTSIGDNAYIRNVGGIIRGAHIGHRVTIENIGRIEFDPEARCGLLTEVCVLDETGSRPVPIYPGLSSQVAHLAAHYPKWTEEHLKPMLDEHFGFDGVEPRIGDDAVITDTQVMRNVTVDHHVSVRGAASLVNGMIVNTAPAGRGMAAVGTGVDAENFIIEDGRVDAGALLRNCYVGQGAIIDKRFTAHDMLAFANTSLENGEACALLAGPYTVSMHKASLLIGCQTSFMNAGSASNQSNHMYKLGPVHWGVMERGVKTASASYIMWGAKIGAFSLVMGVHKNHPDASEFPFSYLFGDEKGATTVVPAMMLRSCGLMRDETKWPTRDRRRKMRLVPHDRINFSVLNPMTVSRMVSSMGLIDSLLQRRTDDDLYIRYKGMKFRASSLERAKLYYRLAIASYLHNLLGSDPLPEPSPDATAERWHDIGGQIVTDRTLVRALRAESLSELEQAFTDAEASFADDQLRWIADSQVFDRLRLRREFLSEMNDDFRRIVDDDRASYRRALAEEVDMLSEPMPPLD